MQNIDPALKPRTTLKNATTRSGRDETLPLSLPAAAATLASLLCVGGCAALGISSFPPPATDCATDADVEFVAMLLGHESIGTAERERLALQAISVRVADSAAYCSVAMERLR